MTAQAELGVDRTERSTQVRFPPGFTWGVATAAYQIEGAVTAEGRTPSIWDTFSRLPGAIANGDTGDIADDHYHQWRSDVALMSQLGLDSYRFSIAWPRITPEVTIDGIGMVNTAGLEFYDRLVDALLGAAIAPAVTLYHWDLPQALEDAGGWTDRRTAERFAEYAALVAQRLGDRVASFLTLNEPWCSAFLGYASGVHAPGRCDPAASLAAVHHLNLAHGLAVDVLRQHAPGSRVGVTLNLASVRPAGDTAADLAAAHRIDGLQNRVFLDPILRGEYPADIVAATSSVTDWGFVCDGDLAVINKPIEIIGLNYYSPTVVRAYAGAGDRQHADGHGNTGSSPWPACDDIEFMPPDGPVTAMGWGIDAGGLRDLLTRLAVEYPGHEILVTENGAAYDDVVGADGRVHDERRIAYLADHLTAVRDAIDAGADVRGYYLWSLLDNFEWAYGYEKRFGIVHVDYATLARTPKESAFWYQRLIAANGFSAP